MGGYGVRYFSRPRGILQPGRMDRRITIEEPTWSQGKYGNPTKTWADWVTDLPANMFEGPGREFDAARQLNAEMTTQFQIRYRSGLSPTMRVLYAGVYYEILWIQEVGRFEGWNIWTKARRT